MDQLLQPKLRGGIRSVPQAPSLIVNSGYRNIEIGIKPGSGFAASCGLRPNKSSLGLSANQANIKLLLKPTI
jgi:hypothetical protein